MAASAHVELTPELLKTILMDPASGRLEVTATLYGHGGAVLARFDATTESLQRAREVLTSIANAHADAAEASA